MTEIKPFRGARYNSGTVDLSLAVAPPYDVINDDQQEMLYKRYPHNVVRLILGKVYENDNKENNRYTRARKFIDAWERSGVLIRDELPSIYLYIQRFKIQNKTYERHGFITLIKLDSDIYTHEKTLSKPKKDRLELMKACEGNLSPVFVLYDDEKRCVECITISPAIHTMLAHIKEDDEEHFLYRITDEKIINTVETMIADRKVYIADGHHRYETAKNYRDYMFSIHGKDDNADYNYIMAYFTNISDAGLVILPTHRVVCNVKFSEQEFVEKFRSCFDVKLFNSEHTDDAINAWIKEIKNSGRAFGVKCYGSDNLYILYNYRPKRLLNDTTAAALKSLDVYILNKEILEGILNIPEQSFSSGGSVSYFHEPNKALTSLRSGDVAFILNAPSKEDVKAVALNSLNMPQKTTFFYPKLLSGLVFHLFNR